MSSSDDGSTRGNGFHPAAPPAAQMDPVLLRREMVEWQLLKRGIRDERVVAAMLSVPRHEFVPAGLAGEAYSDRPLPIGHDQTISQPFMVAAMTEALQLSGSERVLEIGAGSGYQAAVLSLLAREVHTVESCSGSAMATCRCTSAMERSDGRTRLHLRPLWSPRQRPRFRRRSRRSSQTADV